MIAYVRNHLGIKLFLSYLAVILIGAVALLATTRYTAAPAFNRHIGMMEEFTPGPLNDGMGNMMGRMETLEGAQRNDFRRRLLEQFQSSFREALNWSALAAGITALIVSLILSRRVITPVRAMTAASQRLADGHYDERVATQSADELGQLAASFNTMAEKLQSVEEMRRQLIGDVAHELRTPLTAIKGTMEALEDGILPAEAKTYQDVLREAERLNRLVDDLQELSHVEAKAYELSRAPVQLRAPFQSIEKRFRPKFAKKDVEFHIALPAPLPEILVDEGRLIQIITNLLNNALYYTPSGGRVNLRVENQTKNLLISVEDTGIGIPSHELEHIFTRFYRVDKSRSRHAGGSGIGLTLAKYLVEAHGGEIWVESTGKDQGSTFKFTLPTEQN